MKSGTHVAQAACLVLLIGVLVTACESKAETLLQSEITDTVVLEKSGSPYIAQGSVVIHYGGSLSAEPGVVILMPESAGIEVYGEFNLNGTADDAVTVTSYHEHQRWSGLFIEWSPAELITLSHVVIKNTSVEYDPERNRAAVTVRGSALLLDTVRFENVQGGVYVNGGNLTAQHCTFFEDNLGEHLKVKDATALIKQCIFYGTISDDADAIDFEGVYDGVIHNCRIFSSGDDGIDIGEWSTDITISGTHVYDCYDKGISVGEESSVTVERCILTGSSTGIAVFDGAWCSIDHTTLYDQDIAVHCYEGNSMMGGGHAIIVSSIVSHCYEMPILFEDTSSLSVSYSLSDVYDDLLEGEGMIFSDPRFVNIQNRNFNLKSDSPCIDAGHPDSTLDPDGSKSDIGAYFFVFLPVIINEINYHSSVEFNPEDWVELYNPNDTAVDMSYWVFKDEDEGHEFNFSDTTVIEPHGYLVLCKDASAFHDYFPEVENYVGNFDFRLNSTGELIMLLNARGEVADSLTYGITPPWPGEPDGTGSTLSLRDSESDNALAESWSSSSDHGTPGAENGWLAGVGEPSEQDVPAEFSLGQNFPNPFNQVTTIPFCVSKKCRVTIKVYSVLGQVVAELCDGYMAPGNHTVYFAAKDYATGIYLYSIEADGYVQARQMILLK